jgi:hypothetical protein
MCGGAAHEVLTVRTSLDQYELAAGVSEQGYRREWVRCSACGFHFSRYTRPPDGLDRLYERGYRSEKAVWRPGSAEEVFRRVIDLPPDQSETAQRIRWIKDEIEDLRSAELITLGSPPYRLADVGGASGVFAWSFQQDGQWVAHVIDPSDEADFIETSLHIPLMRRKYERGLFDQPLDLVSMVFVLEHLVDPDTALGDVRHDLNEYGLLYVEVPDVAAFHHKPPEDDIFNSTHLWMFDPVSLVKLLSRCAFEVLALKRRRTVRGHYSLATLSKPLASNRRSH